MKHLGPDPSPEAVAMAWPRISEKFSYAPGGCWMWTARREPGRPGRCLVAGRAIAAHRLTYVALRGPIPPGLVIDHLCRERGCVNPYHMEPVSNAENTRRGLTSRERCRKGHSYGRPEPGGGRTCEKCKALRNIRLRSEARFRAAERLTVDQAASDLFYHGARTSGLCVACVCRHREPNIKLCRECLARFSDASAFENLSEMVKWVTDRRLEEMGL